MNDKLIDTKIEIHKKEFDRLQKMESELIDMLSKIDNEELQEKFIDWMNQRSRCNETYLAIQNAILTKD